MLCAKLNFSKYYKKKLLNNRLFFFLALLVTRAVFRTAQRDLLAASGRPGARGHRVGSLPLDYIENSGPKYRRQAFFQHDNDHKHIKITQELLERRKKNKEKPYGLKPSMSPELKQTEHHWNILKSKVEQQEPVQQEAAERNPLYETVSLASSISALSSKIELDIQKKPKTESY